MAAFSGKCTDYKKSVLDAYKLAGQDSAQRMRLEAAAKQTDIYPELKRFALQHEATLFSNSNVGGLLMDYSTTNNFTLIGDGNQVSGVTQAKSLKDITIENVQKIQDAQLKEPLIELIKIIEESSALAQDKKQILDEISELAQSNSPEKANQLLETLKVTGIVGNAGIVIAKIVAWAGGVPL